MSEEYRVITSPVVGVTVTSSVSSFPSERRFQKDLTIAALKGKLEMLTGAMCGSMHLEVYDSKDHLVCKLDNNDALLGSYPVDEGMRIHVVDTSIKLGEFEDVSKVEKYEMSAEDYEKKTDSVRAFKEKMKMGRFKELDPEEAAREAEDKQRQAEEEKAKAESIKVNDRCEVLVAGNPTRRGTVMHVGVTDFQPGYWVGVKYDEPLGKNDGMVKGRRYFECAPKYGGFVKPNQVTVGDFPELGFEDDVDEM